MKKILTLLLSLVLAFSFVLTGCSKSTTSNDDSKKQEDSDSKKQENSDSEKQENSAPEEIVTLKWVQPGTGMPDNYDEWIAKLNEYLEEKIGVHLDLEVVSWANWPDRRSVMINSGEYFDIIFTNYDTFMSDVNVGAYYDIKDIVKTASSDLYSFIPTACWQAATIKDSVYAVPTYKDSSISTYIVWDKAIAEKYVPNYQDLHTLADLTDALTAVKEGENTNPFPLTSGGLIMITNLYDGMGLDLPFVGVRYDDESQKVVSVFEQQDIVDQLKTLHEWYNRGIINADASTTDTLPNYKNCLIGQGWSYAAKTSWGPYMGVEAEAVKINETIITNNSVRGSMNAISSGCKYPEKALELLQLVNLDTKVRDALYYGLEGDNFEYVDGKVKELRTDWSMARYAQGTFFTVTQLVDTEFNQWDEVKSLNEQAIPSVLLGFSVDASNIQNEIANTKSVYSKYQSELMTGTKAPEELIPLMLEELKKAGLEKIMTEAQSQIDAYYK